MEEKKAKRPRIGAALSASASENGEGEIRYEKVNYPAERVAQSTERPQYRSNYNDRPYQPRQQQNNYQRQSGYNNNRYNNYGQQQNYYQQRHNFESRQELTSEQSGAIDNIQSNLSQSEGGYTPRQQYNNYQQRPYNNNRQGGYNNYHNNRYDNYQRPYNNDSDMQDNSYTPRQNRQGGYNNNHQGGYNNRQGGYNNRQGGYNNRQGGYNNRQNGYKNNRQQKNRNNGDYNPQGMRFTPRPKAVEYVLNDIDPNEPIRLNKFMANSGVCSRREADEYIVAGLVKVNGEVVTELGTKISRSDVVEYNEKVVTPERKCYILLNKPKDCVTTTDDPNGRKTVLDLVKNACQERIYPVGRLDRNTTGVLLLTNDGDLASKLTHPKFVKKKIYHVWTDKDISEDDMQRIADGIELEDGEIHADAISYVTEKDRNQAGIEIHSGRNRIVRRIFESLGYRVTKLDRVYFAGLTKKNLPRGKWRYLSQEEVNYLRQGSFE